jgi:hypothetical protein
MGRGHLNALRFGQTQREGRRPDTHSYRFAAQRSLRDDSNLLTREKAQFGQSADRFLGDAACGAHGSDVHYLTFFHMSQ